MIIFINTKKFQYIQEIVQEAQYKCLHSKRCSFPVWIAHQNGGAIKQRFAGWSWSGTYLLYSFLLVKWQPVGPTSQAAAMPEGGTISQL